MLLGMYDLIVIGGGAAGIFSALAAKAKCAKARVLLLEKSGKLLSKVRISGGGRCNVTHACFDPLALTHNYPRGNDELKGPFHQFQPRDTMHWFESRGCPLKVEEDGRVFPVSDNSESIIRCLLDEAKKLQVEIWTHQKIDGIERSREGFLVGQWRTKKLLLATGSSEQGYVWAKGLGHCMIAPVPSLFTFHAKSFLNELSGVTVDSVQVQIPNTHWKQVGPLLITHFGFSGPAILKLSAWAARDLFACAYRFSLAIHWLYPLSQDAIFNQLLKLKSKAPQKTLASESVFH